MESALKALPLNISNVNPFFGIPVALILKAALFPAIISKKSSLVPGVENALLNVNLND